MSELLEQPKQHLLEFANPKRLCYQVDRDPNEYRDTQYASLTLERFAEYRADVRDSKNSAMISIVEKCRRHHRAAPGAKQRAKKPPIERFMRLVIKSEGCWIWIGSFHSNGYGQFWLNNRGIHAHRASYFLHKGIDSLPPEIYICHKCDNKKCVKPDHLFEGTATDNALDAGNKGLNGMQKHPERSSLNRKINRPQPRGEQQGAAKLTEQSVRDIRAQKIEGMTYVELGHDYKVSKYTIQKICQRRAWRHVL